jgi:hypothetical protein
MPKWPVTFERNPAQIISHVDMLAHHPIGHATEALFVILSAF